MGGPRCMCLCLGTFNDNRRTISRANHLRLPEIRVRCAQRSQVSKLSRLRCGRLITCCCTQFGFGRGQTFHGRSTIRCPDAGIGARELPPYGTQRAAGRTGGRHSRHHGNGPCWSWSGRGMRLSSGGDASRCGVRVSHVSTRIIARTPVPSATHRQGSAIRRSAARVQACSRGACSRQPAVVGERCCDDICQAQCCTSADCPSYEEQCGTNNCVGGECIPTPNCTVEQRCCGYDTPGAYCADECCSDAECPGCEICNGAGICEETECCGDSDCASVCGECVEGTCVPRCDTREICCSSRNECLNPGQCCSDDECPCGGSCSEGTCYPQPPCPEGQECCADECVPLGQCSQLCLPEGDTCDGQQLECCVGLQCCGVNGGSTCQECCANSDCDDPCEICVEGECVGACSQSQECCDDECVAIGTCCQELGETCAVTSGPGTQGNCCDDLLCCATGQGGQCAECCDSSDCWPCAYCSNGTLLPRLLRRCDGPCEICYGEHCSQSESCCDGECVDDDDGCCNPEGSICGVVPSDDSEQLDCCDGLRLLRQPLLRHQCLRRMLRRCRLPSWRPLPRRRMQVPAHLQGRHGLSEGHLLLQGRLLFRQML